MPGCTVVGCNNYSSITKGSDVRYFKFPKEKDLAKQYGYTHAEHGTISCIHKKQDF